MERHAGPVARLFVYGTLMPGRLRWPHLQPYAVAQAPAEMMGTIYDTGRGWPAVLVDHTGDGALVPGVVITIDAPRLSEALAVIDEVEGTADGLFERTLATTVAGDEVWTYVYAGPIAGLRRIERWDVDSDDER